MASIGEIMTKDVYTTTGETPVVAAAQAMVKGRFGSAVIVEAGWLVGIFTERDVLRAAASGKDLSATPVSEWMTKDPQTATAEMESEEAAQIMAANGFRHLPVMDGKNVLGVVSLRDVMGARIGRAVR
ncbi:MAG: CBS domain-containing protein [Actinobacteria bacterium]|nr:MAG: CBS domain-containing protein [Actinomycetota bacterium]